MGKRLDFLLATMKQPSDACALWPFALYGSGYGQMAMSGRKMTANHAMCELAYGAPPAGKTQAAHSCGNRSCVNPKHLRWANGYENNGIDKVQQGRMPEARGERNGRAKLTGLQVAEIRQRAFAGEKHNAIAADFGVTFATVSDIKRGKSWGRPH